MRAFLVLVALSAVSCTGGAPGDETGSIDEILRARAQKDQAFRAADSPVPPGLRDELLPLSYFPPAPSYAVPAALRVASERIVVQMPTSTGKLRAMERAGVLEFTLKGRSMTLAAFVEAGSPSFDRLFVPFTDLTSGAETYPAGRYLDLDRTKTGIYVIDFNWAYHPYCYYNPAYDCPYPPAENRLSIPVRAGERLREVASSQ